MAATYNAEMSKQLPAPKTFAPSREDVISTLGFFFGDPAVPEKLKDYSEHHAMTYHFPDAFYGQNTKIRETLNNLILKSPQDWQTGVGLPFVRIEGTTVEWDELRFDVRLLQRVPYEGERYPNAYPATPEKLELEACGRFATGSTSMDTSVDCGEWRAIPGYEGQLQVSSNGFVKQFLPARGYWREPKKPAPNANGYVIVYNDHIPLRVHTLVALAFLGPRPEGCTVDHIDRDRANNTVSNLRWATKAQQIANRGFRQPREKISITDKLPGEEFRRWSNEIAVSQFGRILSKGNIYHPMPGSRDYATVSADRKTFQFHRIVAEVWPDIVGTRWSEGLTVDHIDRNRENNAASNLRWATPSQQALNRHRPKKRSAAQLVDQVAVDIAAPYLDAIHWVTYESYCDAAAGISESICEPFTQNQVGQIIRLHPEGYTATKGAAKGWSFRLHTASGSPSDVPAKKPRVIRNMLPNAVDVQAPGSNEWVGYNSASAAARGIHADYGARIAQGSISRFVNLHPEGHTITTKQNAGWSFRKRC